MTKLPTPSLRTRSVRQAPKTTAAKGKGLRSCAKRVNTIHEFAFHRGNFK